MGDVWKKLVTVCGRKTEVWGTGQAAGAYVHIVVIPGNPGSAGAPECAPLSPLGKTPDFLVYGLLDRQQCVSMLRIHSS